MLALLVIMLCLVSSCKEEKSPAYYVIHHVEEPLSSDEVSSAFDFLGLKMERFECYFPDKRQVTFFGQKFMNGAAQSISGEATLYLDPGLQQFILFVHRENDSVSFGVKAGSGRVGCGRPDLEGFGGSTQGWLYPKELKSGPEVPLYLFAANKNSTQGFSSDEEIEEILKKYDLAFVLYADIH